MKIYYLFTLLSFMGLYAGGCSQSNGNEPAPTPDPTPEPPAKKLEIKISASVKSTKATDFGFENGDKIGLYVVNYSGTTPGSLVASGNQVDNMCFTYSGTWTPTSPVYWQDNKTHADFYLYYPYRSSIADVNALAVETCADQSVEANYKASDFMIGSTKDVAPSESAVSIAATHLFSRINIKVEAGNGFTEKSLKSEDMTVRINGLKNKANVNLVSGEIQPTGEDETIIPYKYGEYYRAIVIPQSVEYGNLITIGVGGKEYNFTKEFRFESNKEHNFTITVNKTSNGINVNIDPWENDGTDNGGSAE